MDFPNMFSEINHSGKGIKLPWIGSRKDKLFSRYGFHTGIDLYATGVYSLSSGVVISVGLDGKHYAVTIQYNSFSALRYLHLKETAVQAGQAVQSGFHVGNADQYVHFEYVTKEQKESIWSVRIGTMTYYKHNPLDMIDEYDNKNKSRAAMGNDDGA